MRNNQLALSFGKLQCSKQKDILPLPFIDPVGEVSEKWHIQI
jgi:hypothetical protein